MLSFHFFFVTTFISVQFPMEGGHLDNQNLIIKIQLDLMERKEFTIATENAIEAYVDILV